MPLLDENDKKLLCFLNKQRTNRKYVVFCSLFSFLVGFFLFIGCFIEFHERFFYGGLLFVFMGFVLIITNNKFNRILDLIEKIISHNLRNSG